MLSPAKDLFFVVAKNAYLAINIKNNDIWNFWINANKLGANEIVIRYFKSIILSSNTPSSRKI